uniref:Uncharacterized protein n=1 Tax=Arundo donax TaxID=35708 RepID=A0A0A8ZSM5_ARUDO
MAIGRSIRDISRNLKICVNISVHNKAKYFYRSIKYRTVNS